MGGGAHICRFDTAKIFKNNNASIFFIAALLLFLTFYPCLAFECDEYDKRSNCTITGDSTIQSDETCDNVVFLKYTGNVTLENLGTINASVRLNSVGGYAIDYKDDFTGVDDRRATNNNLYNYGTITGDVTFSSGASRGNAANVDSGVYNWGTIYGYVGDVSTQKLNAENNALYNYGDIVGGVNIHGSGSAKMNADDTVNYGDTGNGFSLYNEGTIGLYYDSSTQTYYHLWLGDIYTGMTFESKSELIAPLSSYTSPTIYSYHNKITESASTFNAFTTYTSQSTDTNHLVIRTSSLTEDNESVTGYKKYNVQLADGFIFYLSVGSGSTIYYTSNGDLTSYYLYQISKLILDESGNTYTFYYNDGSTQELLVDYLGGKGSASLYEYLSSALTLQDSSSVQAYELKITECDDEVYGYCFYFAVKDNNDYTGSIVNAWQTANIQTLHVLHSHVKRNTFGIHNREHLRKVALNDYQRERIALLESSRERFAFGADAYPTAVNEVIDKRKDDGVKQLGKQKETAKTQESNKTSTQESTAAQVAISPAPQLNDDYYFFFSPFVTYNSFSDGQKLDGFNYGFVSGFNGKINNINTLGVHLGVIYGDLNNRGSSRYLDITTLGLALGLHYKLDFAYGMFLKAYLEGYAFMSDIDYAPYGYTSTYFNQTPNSLGVGASVYFGKDFDFDKGGMLGLELGLLYWGLQSKAMDFSVAGAETYGSTFLNLAYIDLGVNYSKVFQSGFGVNAELGVRTRLNDTHYSFALNGMTHANNTISADRVLGYVGVGGSYFVSQDVELGLQYLGHFGYKSTSHSGFFNVRVWW